MKAAALLSAAALVAGLAVDAEATTSSAPEYRGFENCVDAADAELPGLVTSRDYFFGRTPEANRYFINGTAWDSGERVHVRVACDTTRNGRELLDYTIAEGTFVLDSGRVDVRIAQN